MKQMINKISATWQPIGEMPTVYPNETYKMLKMQKLAYEALKNSSDIIINAPTASGKTLAICWMVAKKLIDSPSSKAIISVPQTIIADGFRGAFNLTFEENGNIVSWCPRHFLCADNTANSNVELVERFLDREGQISEINDRILVCSHASLVDAFQKYPQHFKDLVIVVDEAHHISYSEGEEIEDGDGRGAMVFCNQMGAIVATALKEQEKRISLILSTATLFRGDRLEIIPEKYKDRFETFHYPMDEYLKDCHWLKSFSYDFAMYEGSYKKRMMDLFKDKVGKTIVYVPHVMSKRYSSGSKEKDWENVYKSIAGKDRYQIKEQDNGLTLIKRGNKWIKVVNLVDDSDMSLRDKRKGLIIEAHKHSNGDMLDVIVALNMFKEGANWKWADREIIVGTKGSLTDMNQIVGRLFRDAKEKNHIQTIQLLPFSFDQIDKDGFRENLNDYMKVIFATMLLEEAIKPLKINVPFKNEDVENNGEKKDNKPKVEFVDYLRQVVKDENKIHAIQKEIMIQSVTAQDNGEIDFGLNSKKSRERFEKIVSEVLSSKGVKVFHKEISQQIHKSWLRESVKTIKGIDLDNVDFETIQVNPLSFILTYTSGMCNLDTFRKFREAVNNYCFLPFEEARAFVRELKLKSQKGWRKYYQSGLKPNNIPVSPDSVYLGCGWVSWGDFLGTNTIASKKGGFKKFLEARKFVRNLKIKTFKEWQKYCASLSKPEDIPSNASNVYKNKGWVSWGDWLGTDYVAMRNREYLSFKSARKFAKKLNLKCQEDWIKKAKEGSFPKNVPLAPHMKYRDNGWVSWGDFLGTGRVQTQSRKYRDFQKAKTFVHSLNLKSSLEWRKYCKSKKIPMDIPANPNKVYKDSGWLGMGDWLGTGRIADIEKRDKVFKTFKDSRKIVQKLKLKNIKEWQIWSKTKRPESIPSNPSVVYKDKGWVSWGDFLNNGNLSCMKKGFRSFLEARSFSRKLNIKGKNNWAVYCKGGSKPEDIPSCPNRTYKNKGWISWQDWLGKKEKK